MLDWNEYIEQLLSRESSFDGISLSIGDATKPVGVPPIIKASVLMLDRMLECQGKFNILVFPERIQSIFIFTLVKLLYNISEGRIERAYDPEKFQPGEHLKLGKAVVEFLRVEERYGKKHIVLRLADLETSAPIEYFPLFQKTTATRLSKDARFTEEKKAAKALLSSVSPKAKYLKLLTDYRTHMDSSIVNMTSVINMKEQINDCKLFGKDVSDLLLIGQADYAGNVRNIGAGQLGGIPAIVLASDLYAIAEMAQNGRPIQSIIIDGSNAGALLSQLDALDDLMRLGVPITCVTDIVNSFDLQPFLDRKFNLWRWDETSITDKLYDAVPLSSDQKTKHCAKRNVEHLISDGNEISTAIRKLSFHKGEAQTLSAQMLKLFDRLYSLAFTALREIVPFDDSQISQNRRILDECTTILAAEKNYIAPKTYDDYCIIIDSLKKIFTKGYILPKHDVLGEKLKKEKYKSICIVVPERAEKKHVQDYWQMWCRRKMLSTQVFVLHPAEYYPAQCTQFSATIVVGWLKRAIMRKILYSFNTQSYTVLMYDYEKGWRNFSTAKWNAALDNSQNRQVIEKSFATDKIQISTTRFDPRPAISEETPKADEYEEIEMILRENKYRQYIASGGKKSANETTEAIPVNFVGGYLAFYRTGHKVLSATNIIVNDSDKIKDEDKKLPSELKLGDFVVVREADRDIIKEIADVVLERSGKTGHRELATKWKEALDIETLFYTNDQIYQRLVAAGCTRGPESVYRWLTDEDMIAPQGKEDLQYIAKVTGSTVLSDMLDQIYDAAQTVKAAHSKAGKILSDTLKTRIVEAIDQYGDIDPFNIWEPIEMQVDGIGTVRILKIIDIGAPVIVDIADTNRLIDEE
jgi:hypothetical protein